MTGHPCEHAAHEKQERTQNDPTLFETVRHRQYADANYTVPQVDGVLQRRRRRHLKAHPTGKNWWQVIIIGNLECNEQESTLRTSNSY